MKRAIKSSKWNYTLKNGQALRRAIDNEDPVEIINQLRICYQELLDAGLIDDYDFESYTEDFEVYGDFDDDDDPEDTVDFELTQFYDLCDNIGVWVSI